MSVQEYETQPLKSRLDYVLAKEKDVSDNGYLADFFNQKIANGEETLAYYSPSFKPLNEFANGQDIVYQNVYLDQLITAWKTDVTVEGDGDLDQDTAMKMVSAYAFAPDSEVYKSRAEAVANSTIAGRFSEADIAADLVTDTTANENFKNPTDGSDTVEKTVTMVRHGKTLHIEYVFIPTPDQLGDGNGLWIEASETIK